MDDDETIHEVVTRDMRGNECILKPGMLIVDREDNMYTVIDNITRETDGNIRIWGAWFNSREVAEENYGDPTLFKTYGTLSIMKFEIIEDLNKPKKISDLLKEL
jgi:hypothetical protein